MQDLEGDGSIVLEIMGQKDRRHPTAAQLPIDRVSVGQRVAQAFENRGHKSSGLALRNGYTKG